MTGIRLPRFAGFAVGLSTAGLLAACLSGCAPTDPEPTSTPSPVSTTSATASPSATPTPEPVAPVAATCENLLDPAALEGILSDGFDVLPVNGYVEKIRAEGSPYALFEEYGGIVCPVNNGTRVSELFAYSSISASDEAAQKSRLLGEGWIESSQSGGALYVDPVEQEGIVFAFYFRNGFWWCGYDSGVITMIVANSPAS